MSTVRYSLVFGLAGMMCGCSSGDAGSAQELMPTAGQPEQTVAVMPSSAMSQTTGSTSGPTGPAVAAPATGGQTAGGPAQDSPTQGGQMGPVAGPIEAVDNTPAGADSPVSGAGDAMMEAPAAMPGGALSGSCPDGFVPAEGLNAGFASGDAMRQFHVWPSEQGEGPRPLFVSLTGTVQEEVAFAQQAGLRQLTAGGWIVVSPLRSCSQEGRNCSTTGTDGRVWEPWYDATIGGGDDAGPDVAFIEAMIQCVATGWSVAADQIYTGGISAGGSFTNRNMTFNSDLFAGGVAASGNWTYGVPPASPMPMERSIVVVVWGGPNDMWPGSPPYSGETKAAAEYYAAQPEVVTVACSGTHGHSWPAAMTPWLAQTLLSHPKGSDPASFVLTEPPGGVNCVVGAYTDH